MTAIEFALGLLAIAAALSLVMSLAWAVEQATGNSGWIDTAWTFGLGAVGIACALIPFAVAPSASALRRFLVAIAVFAWAMRLGLHIASRTAGIVDDPRYAALRQGWGPGQASWQMWLLAQKQALVSIPLALSIFLAARNPAPALRLQDLLAALIFIVALAGEAIADRQLREFRGAARGRTAVCDAGLWRWSRHPNYFFEWLGWLGYAVIAVDLTGAYAWGWLALAGPACMYWLLVYVSGIPPLEEHMQRTRGEAFRAYQARTSAFFPLPPGRSAQAVPR
jgi:steroid 5-alpha reductase family enzyme